MAPPVTARPIALVYAGLLILPLVLAVATPAEAQGGAGTPLLIGAIVNKANGCASNGNADLDAMQLAIDHINEAGGVNGESAQLLSADGRCTRSGARTAFSNLRNQGATAIVFTGTDAQLAELAKLAEETRTVFVAARGGNTNATAGLEYTYTARVHPYNFTEGQGLVNVLLRDGRTSTQMVYMGNDYGYDVLIGLANSLPDSGIDYTEAVGINPVAPDYTSVANQVAQRAEQEGYDTLLFAGEAPHLAEFMEALEAVAGLASVRVYASGGGYGAHNSVGNTAAGDNLLNGVTIVGVATSPSYVKPYGAFADDFQAAFGAAHPTYGEYAYDAVAVVALAAETADDPSSASIQRYLRTQANGAATSAEVTSLVTAMQQAAVGKQIQWVGPTGPLGFDSAQDRTAALIDVCDYKTLDGSFNCYWRSETDAYLELTDIFGYTPEAGPAPPVETPKPTITFVGLTDGASIGTSYKATVEVRNYNLLAYAGRTPKDGEGHIHYFVDGSPAPGTYATPSTTYTFNLAEGPHTIRAELVKSDHSLLSPRIFAEVEVTVGANNAPPNAVLTVPSNLVAGTAASFSASGSTDTDGTITKYEWDWDGNGAFDQTTTTSSASHTFHAAGTVTVGLRVTDNRGATDLMYQNATVKAAATPVTPPKAAFTLQPTTGTTATTFQANAGASTGSGTLSYAWDWEGDGTYAPGGVTSSHKYTQAGTYKVSLRVTDSQSQTATAMEGAEVTAPAVSTTTGSIVGTVRTVTGPLAGATVQLFSLNAQLQIVPLDKQATTDAQGNYRFDGLAPGIYDLQATGPGNSGAALPITGVQVNAGEEARQDLVVGNIGTVKPELAGIDIFGKILSREISKNILPPMKAGEEIVATVEATGHHVKKVSIVPAEAIAQRSQLLIGGVDALPVGMGNPPDAGKVYEHVLIELMNDAASAEPKLSGATIRFEVEKAWIEGQGVDPTTITLWHFNDNPAARRWEPLVTQAMGTAANGNLIFEAKSPGFSQFAIAGKTPSVILTLFASIPWWGYLSGGSLLLIGIAAVLLLKRKPSTKASLDFEKKMPAGAMPPPPPPPMVNAAIKDLKLSDEFSVSELTVRAGDKAIVQSVSFGFPRGKTLAILGPSGCGKSTTLKAIVGENPSFEGDVSVFGLDPRKDKEKLKYVVGYVPQDTQLYDNMTVAENIAYFGSQYGMSKKELQVRVPQILKVLGLEERANLNVKSLSGGQQRRASIGATLVFNPKLIILDEPTSGLDPVTRRNLWSFLKQINRELDVSVIVTTHFLDEAELADNILILNRGKVAAQGAPDGLKREMPGGGKAMTVELFTPAEQLKDKLDRVVERLMKESAIAASDRAGYFLKLYASNPQQHTREVLDALSSEGVPFSGIDIVDATLEDVFVYTTGEKFVVKGKEA